MSNGIDQVPIDWMPDFCEGPDSQGATWQSIVQRVEGYNRGLANGQPLLPSDVVRLKSIYCLGRVAKEVAFHRASDEASRGGCDLAVLLGEEEANQSKAVQEYLATVEISCLLGQTIAGYMRLYGVDPGPVLATSSPLDSGANNTWVHFEGAVMAGVFQGGNADRSASPVSLKPKTSTKRAKTNTLMLEILQNEPESAAWTITQWVDRTGRARATIQRTVTWQRLNDQHLASGFFGSQRRNGRRLRKSRPDAI
jgi:hypothetical protein